MIGAILVSVPASQLNSVSGFIEAFGIVSGTHGHLGGLVGSLIAIIFLYTFLGTATAWLMGGDRAFAVAGMTGTAPSALGRLSTRFGTPVRVNVLSGLVATLVFVATQVLSRNLLNQFTVALNLTVAVSVMSYLFVFPSFLILRLRQPTLDRPFRVPGGLTGAWIVTIVCEAYALITVAVTLWPSAVPSSTLDRQHFELIQGGCLVLFIIIASVLSLWGSRQRENETGKI